jgi:hypothetical protein
MMKRVVIHVYLRYNIVNIEEQLMGIALLIEDMSGKSTSVINCTHCIPKAILCSGSIDIDHIRE